MLTFTGTLKVKGDTTQVSSKFSKREFVLCDNAASYPQSVQFQVCQKNCDLLDSVKVGDEVEVTFNLKGREWTSPQGEVKYFNTLDVFRIKKVSQGNKSVKPEPNNDLPW